MLAYSSIAHAGYLLSAMVAAPRTAAEAILFYLVAYAAVNLGGFGALAALANGEGREPLSADDLAGAGAAAPVLAAALTVFLVSLNRRARVRGLRGEVLPLQRGGVGRLRGAGRGRRPHERGLRVLLLAGRGGDVHARGRGRGHSWGAPSAVWLAWPWPCPRRWSWALGVYPGPS